MNILEILTEDILGEIINFLKKRGFDKNEITFGFNSVIDVFSSLPEKFKIYRIIKIDNPSQLDKTKLGVHWTLDKTTLTDKHYHSDKGEGYCIITAYVTIDLVKIKRTIELNIEYPNEKEILLDDSKDLNNLQVLSIDCF